MVMRNAMGAVPTGRRLVGHVHVLAVGNVDARAIRRAVMFGIAAVAEGEGGSRYKDKDGG